MLCPHHSIHVWYATLYPPPLKRSHAWAKHSILSVFSNTLHFALLHKGLFFERPKKRPCRFKRYGSHIDCTAEVWTKNIERTRLFVLGLDQYGGLFIMTMSFSLLVCHLSCTTLILRCATLQYERTVSHCGNPRQHSYNSIKWYPWTSQNACYLWYVGVTMTIRFTTRSTIKSLSLSRCRHTSLSTLGCIEVQ